MILAEIRITCLRSLISSFGQMSSREQRFCCQLLIKEIWYKCATMKWLSPEACRYCSAYLPKLILLSPHLFLSQAVRPLLLVKEKSSALL